MSCPTCDHTMCAIGCKVTDRNFYWCPRCGTIKPCDDTTAAVPDLVDRCREFEKRNIRPSLDSELTDAWVQCDLAEAINTPGNRL